MGPPDWALTTAFWLHMLATVVWIGSLAALALFFIPIGRRTLDPDAFATFLADVQRRLDPLAWFALVTLVATGLVQMTGNPNYDGFLAINNRWATAILAKHLVFVGMIAVSAVMTWKVLPSLRREALRRTRGKGQVEDQRLSFQEQRLLTLNLVLSLVVLALTALARTAS